MGFGDFISKVFEVTTSLLSTSVNYMESELDLKGEEITRKLRRLDDNELNKYHEKAIEDEKDFLIDLIEAEIARRT